jgi:hypothetical protein
VLPEESVSLRYLIRLCVQEATGGKRLWNSQVYPSRFCRLPLTVPSQEITFYDSGLSALPSYIDLVRTDKADPLENV